MDLDSPLNSYIFDNCQEPQGLKGNPVKLGSGPAAVTGDEICESHCRVRGAMGRRGE